MEKGNKIKKGTFLLKEIFNTALTSNELQAVTSEYNSLLENDKYALPEESVFKLMLWAKRGQMSFGPYKDLTFFEISNRIYSDLVLLKAADILFKEHEIKSIRLNMSNHSGNDLYVTDKNGIEIAGEAFNAAESFFQIKMRSELKKFSTGRGIIAFNVCALNDKNRAFLERKKKDYKEVLFVECDLNDMIEI